MRKPQPSASAANLAKTFEEECNLLLDNWEEALLTAPLPALAERASSSLEEGIYTVAARMAWSGEDSDAFYELEHRRRLAARRRCRHAGGARASAPAARRIADTIRTAVAALGCWDELQDTYPPMAAQAACAFLKDVIYTAALEAAWEDNDRYSVEAILPIQMGANRALSRFEKIVNR